MINHAIGIQEEKNNKHSDDTHTQKFENWIKLVSTYLFKHRKGVE